MQTPNQSTPDNAMLLQERIVGAMLGLACGDALGAPAEFKSQEQVKARWGLLTEMIGGGMWAVGEWTDDTGMALCIAEGILAEPEEPIEAIGRGFIQWRKTAKDVGTNISAALAAYKGDWPAAARSTPAGQRADSASNGSLMRTLPVALAYPDKENMLRMSARISSMTHWGPQAEVCCAVYCLWIQELLQGRPMQDAWYAALATAREVTKRGALSSDTVGPAPLPDGFWERLENVESLKYSELQRCGYAGYVVECLEAAVWCCLHAVSLEECLVLAVNLAGEADTIAAVAGGAAGAHWGSNAIPTRWSEPLYRREELEHIGIRLARLRRHHEVYATPRLKPFNCDIVCDRITAGRNPLTARDVELLAARGITHILDLREPQEWIEAPFGAEAIEQIEQGGLTRLNVPITDVEAPSPESLDAACRFIDEVVEDKSAHIYIHCRAGIERTGAVLVAYYARRHDVSYDESLAKLRAGRALLKPLSHQAQAARQWLNSGSSINYN